MIIRTEAIVLRSLEYGETSRIVTLYTRHRGKVAVMARGARARKSRFGSTLQPMSYIQVVYYYKPTRDLQTLSESSHVRPFNDIGRNLEKMTVGLRIVEVASSLLEEEQNPEIFALLLQVLTALNDAPSASRNLLPFFQMKLAVALGFEPGFTRASVAGLPDEGGVLSLDTGAIFSGEAMVPSGRRASRAALRAFAICTRAEAGPALALNLSDAERSEVASLIESYYRHHLGASYPLRSTRVLDQLLAGLQPPKS